MLALPAAAEVENFQNWSLLYCGPIREDTMGKALETQMVSNLSYCILALTLRNLVLQS